MKQCEMVKTIQFPLSAIFKAGISFPTKVLHWQKKCLNEPNFKCWDVPSNFSYNRGPMSDVILIYFLLTCLFLCWVHFKYLFFKTIQVLYYLNRKLLTISCVKYEMIFMGTDGLMLSPKRSSCSIFSLLSFEQRQQSICPKM